MSDITKNKVIVSKIETEQQLKEQILDKYAPLSIEEQRTATNEQLVLHNLRLMVKKYKKFMENMSFSEYFSEIIAGMYDAADRFDRNRNLKFATFAEHYVKLYLREHLNCFKNVTVSYNPMAMKKIKAIKKFITLFKAENDGKEPSKADFIKHFNWTEKSYYKSMGYLADADYVYINESVKDFSSKDGNHEKTRGDFIGNKDVSCEYSGYSEIDSPDEFLMQKDAYNKITEIFENVTSELKSDDKIIVTEFFMNNKKPLTLASEYNTTVRYVQRLCRTVKERMKYSLTKLEITPQTI